MKLFKTMLVVCVLGLSCQKTQQSVVVSPSTETGCTGACEQGLKIGCEWAEGTEKCFVWCSDYHDAGYLKPWNDCVAMSTSRDAILQCGLSCEPSH